MLARPNARPTRHGTTGAPDDRRHRPARDTPFDSPGTAKMLTSQTHTISRSEPSWDCAMMFADDSDAEHKWNGA
jgi:hypothetical protein